MFGGPVVGRAHALAAATLAPARLAANAATAGILADLGLDADTVAAALLHDALDASPLTRPQLEVRRLHCGSSVKMLPSPLHMLQYAEQALTAMEHVGSECSIVSWLGLAYCTSV